MTSEMRAKCFSEGAAYAMTVFLVSSFTLTGLASLVFGLGLIDTTPAQAALSGIGIAGISAGVTHFLAMMKADRL